jgi:hypothetical protein
MESPVIIIGAPRSGTSLLSQIIGSHPAIAVPYESHFYETFMPWFRYYGDLQQRGNRERLVRDVLQTAMLRHWVPRVDQQAALTRIEANARFDPDGIFAGIMEAWSAAQGKRRWGEKTPVHVFFASHIAAKFPDAKFVHIVRDGRDVAVSWMRARFGPKDIYHAATGWLSFLAAARNLEATLDPARFFELRYEDLLRDRQSQTRQICAFLGEDYAAGMLDFHRFEGRYPTDARNRKNLARPLIGNNTGKWRRRLSPREIRIFEGVAGEALERNGYERVARNATVSALERLRAKATHPVKRTFAMARNTQGQMDGLIRTLIYLRLRAGL